MSPELPTNTATNQSTYLKGNGAQGAGAGPGQREKDGPEVNKKRKGISREGSDGGELLNEQSRLLNDGKGRLCKWSFSLIFWCKVPQGAACFFTGEPPCSAVAARLC